MGAKQLLGWLSTSQWPHMGGTARDGCGFPEKMMSDTTWKRAGGRSGVKGPKNKPWDKGQRFLHYGWSVINMGGGDAGDVASGLVPTRRLKAIWKNVDIFWGKGRALFLLVQISGVFQNRGHTPPWPGLWIVHSLAPHWPPAQPVYTLTAHPHPIPLLWSLTSLP